MLCELFWILSVLEFGALEFGLRLGGFGELDGGGGLEGG